jgi:hypothetical protein
MSVREGKWRRAKGQGKALKILASGKIGEQAVWHFRRHRNQKKQIRTSWPRGLSHGHSQAQIAPLFTQGCVMPSCKKPSGLCSALQHDSDVVGEHACVPHGKYALAIMKPHLLLLR